MGAFGRNRTKSSKSTYRVTGKRKSNAGTKKKFFERGYGFAYGYVRSKPPKRSQKNTYAQISNEYFKYGRYK